MVGDVPPLETSERKTPVPTPEHPAKQPSAETSPVQHQTPPRADIELPNPPTGAAVNNEDTESQQTEIESVAMPGTSATAADEGNSVTQKRLERNQRFLILERNMSSTVSAWFSGQFPLLPMRFLNPISGR